MQSGSTGLPFLRVGLLLMAGLMRAQGRVVYQTPDELEERIVRRQADAALLPPGATRQSVLKEIAQLRAYADMKRLLTPRRDVKSDRLS